MKQLSETWFTEGFIDFELKKYTLLAYLQQIGQSFNESRLYPPLADAVFHYNTLVQFRENKKYLQEHFPKKLTGIQLQQLQLFYQKLVDDDSLMQELDEIISFATAELQATIHTGAALYEQVESALTIAPVGIVPIDAQEGYFLLSARKTIRVYQYRLSIFEKHQERYRSIRTTYIDEWQHSFVNTHENIKYTLLKQNRNLPCPAVYRIESQVQVPVEETLLPVAKRTLVKYITTAA